ncbi:CLUMA_CG006297, isoform A [Clunio marinus]|uniref:CLUMA_CG006297, isoform A n=1 Tax=Clunio marinus TaxID=568069 RepID=A0A1J1HXT0_9DIPT|nr:CLUMA_CG006297, isoform A [Clunio marinus]
MNLLKIAVFLFNVQFVYLLNTYFQSYAKEEVQKQAARNVIERLIGHKVENISLKINFTLPLNYFKILKTNHTDILLIEASNGVSACKAFQYYLKRFCKAHISWDGNQLSSFDGTFPEAQYEMQSSSQIIYYQNVCTHSYSYSWWSINEWRQHIDWIALSGITLTLAPFQEDVWNEVYKDYGLSQTDITEHFAGPGFFAWQRMGNIRGWGGKLSHNFINFSSILQQNIIQSLNNLGIAIALPSFDGHLPVGFAKIFPDIKFTLTEQWNHFPMNYCCPLFLDPTEPLFIDIGKKFLTRLTEKYGTNHIYFSDPFNEVQPHVSSSEYLRNVSTSIFSIMTSVDQKAVWLLQGWMFVKNPFWTNELIESFLTAVPQGKMLVLDLQSEQHPQYNRTHSFFGQPFIWCMLHNFGGTLGMHGSLELINIELLSASKINGSSLVGVGITPEGIHQNYVVYEFVLEKAWNYKQFNVKKWIKHYSNVRYGFVSKEVESAWVLLLKSVYAFEGQQNIRGKYTYCRRPTLKWKPWKWYDEKYVRIALHKFLLTSTNETLYFNNLFQRDLVDLTRQVLQNQADILYLAIVKNFKTKTNITHLSFLCETFLELLRDLDTLLGTHNDFLLGKFLESSKSLASNNAERKQFEFNARNQITLWGPNGQITDYATKQWNGIVKDYYLPRWSLFFQKLLSSLEQNIPFNQSQFQKSVFEEVEMPFNLENKTYPIVSDGNSIDYSRFLFQKWNNMNITEP